MNIILDERECRENLFPFTLTTHTSHLLIGMCTILEKWKQLTEIPISLDIENADENSLLVPANVIPTEENIDILISMAKDKKNIKEQPNFIFINYAWELFQLNYGVLTKEFSCYIKNKRSPNLPIGATIINGSNVFIEEGAEISPCILNATDGPIFISARAKILDGACLRGPVFIGEDSVIKMGAKIYGATSIGIKCTVGGEIKNSVIFDNSNKAHDGYLGDAVIGSWCNLGAGTSNSNVKNTGTEIKFQLVKSGKPIAVGNKAGLLMGDYSRAAVNSRFNSGTVVGVCCNIFEDVFDKNYIDNFSWNNEIYIFEKAIRDINNWMQMKGTTLSEIQIKTLKEIYELKLKK